MAVAPVTRYIYIDNFTKNKRGLKVTKDVTLFIVLCQNQNVKQRLMLGI